MLKNYLKIGFRNLVKNKVFSLINISGLALGMAVCLLIASYVKDELSYDSSFSDPDQLYRVEVSVLGNGGTDVYPHVDVAVGEGIKNKFPDVTAFTRLQKLRETFVKNGDRQFKENGLAFAEENFFGFFSIPLVNGNIMTALKDPNSMVVTRDLAKKYFGEADPVGQSLIIGSRLYKVTGLVDDLPSNTHFHFSALLSASSQGTREQTWSNVGYYTYLRLKKGADPKAMEAKFPELVEKYVVPETVRDMGVSLAEARKTISTFKFFLQPVKDIHLYSNTKYEWEANGDSKYVYIFAALAIFILLLACANFTNLSTAGSIKRSREVGVRKVLGSGKNQLVMQFLVESVSISLLSLIVALLLVYLCLPLLNKLADKNISFSLFLSPAAIGLELLIALLAGLLAGVYPAFFITSFKVGKILAGSSSNTTGSRSPLRSVLVVFQFAVSTGLIIATFIVYQQLNYMQDKKLGYDKDQLIYLQDAQLLGEYSAQEAFKQSLLQDQRVLSVSIGTDLPGKVDADGTQAYAKDKLTGEDHSEIHVNIYHVDYDYVPTLGLPIIKGRNFSREYSTDSFGVVINEAAVRDLGWSHTDPIGKTIVYSGQREFKVIGIAKDFHYSSLKQKIAPLVLQLGTGYRSGFIVKVRQADVRSTIDMFRNKWQQFAKGVPFAYNFLDEQFAALYQQEEKTVQLFTMFAGISILIACMGLFGLAAYITRQRSKELSVRKVFGASVPGLTFLIAKDFLRLVAIACLLAIPLTWWGMHQWLQDFAYRIDIQWWVFALAAAAAVFLALATVSIQSVKAAMVNPVKNLRNE
ncbi:MAG: cell division protein FtsX [Citrobacter freundii]|nr:MAG: cell division protein FtsX [Citrobacter freundii]